MAQIKSAYAWIGPRDGYATIQWHADSPEKYDWIGLYEGQDSGQNDYLAWQWVSKGSPYITSTIISTGQTVRYFTWMAGTSAINHLPVISVNEVDAEGKQIVTPITLLASTGGSYVELMRTNDLYLEGEVNAPGEYKLQPGCWVSCSTSGYAVLNWTKAENWDSYDWVGLYENVDKSNDEYLTYQWANDSHNYETKVSFSPSIHARYIKHGDKPYVAIRRSKPIAASYFDLLSMYGATEMQLSVETTAFDMTKIFKIMEDQLKKLIHGEASVFSPGFYPFPDNLLFKNLSAQEVQVIAAELFPSQYYDVIMLYYETYLMAIKIADDSERNAKRHAFWQISMFQKFGEDFAKKMGDAHERGRPGTKEDNRVDDLNNKAALQYANAYPGKDPATAANEMWDRGLLEKYRDAVAPEHTKDEL